MLYAAEIKKKNNKPKRPSIKTLFGMSSFLLYVPEYHLVLYLVAFSNPLAVLTETTDSPDQSVEGTLSNRLATQMGVSEGSETSHRSTRPMQYQPKPPRR